MTVSPKPNLQLIYVSDIERSTIFYKTLFNADPTFSSPRYVTFAADGEALFAIWTGGTTPDVAAPRFSEIGIMLASNDDVDRLYEQWQKNQLLNLYGNLTMKFLVVLSLLKILMVISLEFVPSIKSFSISLTSEPLYCWLNCTTG